MLWWQKWEDCSNTKLKLDFSASENFYSASESLSDTFFSYLRPFLKILKREREIQLVLFNPKGLKDIYFVTVKAAWEK